jgi:hypothetical protein
MTEKQNLIDFNDNNDGSPSKRIKITSLQNIETPELHGQESITIEALQGNIEIIIVEARIGQDGYAQPIREGMNYRSANTVMAHFVNSLQLVTFLSRRVSKTNESFYKNERHLPNGDRIPRQVIVRLVDDTSPSSRKSCAQQICDFLNNSDKHHVPARNSPVRRVYDERKALNLSRYYLPHNFDKTKKQGPLNKLGDYVVPKDVIKFIHMTYSEVGQDWAQQNPEHAKCFFDPPYPDLAESELGYQHSLLL